MTKARDDVDPTVWSVITSEFRAGFADGWALFMSPFTGLRAAVMRAFRGHMSYLVLGATSDLSDSNNDVFTRAGKVAESSAGYSRALAITIDEGGTNAASAQRIADLIETIESISFQTNVLALNAAIQAASMPEPDSNYFRFIQNNEWSQIAKRSKDVSVEVESVIASIRTLLETSRIEANSEVVEAAKLSAAVARSISEIDRVATAIAGIAAGSSNLSLLEANAAHRKFVLLLKHVSMSANTATESARQLSDFEKLVNEAIAKR